MPEHVRILIVDDHPVVREGLRALFAAAEDLEVVGEAADGTSALEVVERLGPDVVLMDLSMPVLHGAEAISRIRATAPKVNVLVLTSFASEADIITAIDAGATGYLIKDSPRDELFAAVRSVARGEAALSPLVATRVLDRVRSAGSTTLSVREIEVLTALAEGLTNREIARRLHVSEATIKSHLLHIYTKLDVADRTGAVTTALARGLIRLETTTGGGHEAQPVA